MNIDFPFHFDSRGRTAITDDNDHIHDMIEQFLFTNTGERVNRPDFGAGVQRLVFEPDSSQLMTALRHSLESSLQRYLGHQIAVESIDVAGTEGELAIILTYRDKQQARTVTINV